MKIKKIFFMVRLTSFWFYQNFFWGAMLTIVVPSQVSYIVGESAKFDAISIVFALGALASALISPVVGWLSDRCTLRLGRRRPFIILGDVLAFVPLAMMAFSHDIVLFCIGYFLMQFCTGISTSGFQGLIPDNVAPGDRGLAASCMGAMNFLGLIGGILVAGGLADAHRYAEIYLITAGVMVACLLVTVFGVREKRLEKKDVPGKGAFLKNLVAVTRKNRDFVWMLVSTFFLILGFYLLNFYQQYYISDILKSPTPATDMSTLSVVVVVGAALASILAGVLSNRIGRKVITLVSALCMAVMALVLMFPVSFTLILCFSALFGIGYGAYTSVQWALVTDILPNADEAAKDLGIWSIANTLPQVVGPVIGGGLIGALRTTSLFDGYRLLYAVVIVVLVLGGSLVYRIKKTR